MMAFDFSEHAGDIDQATYSPEDNKLRLYYNCRLPREAFEALRDLGYRSAPKQECFFAKWSPAAEDAAVVLAGEINAEHTSIVERAEAKIDRLDGYISNAQKRSNAYHDRADQLSQRFYGGQPILVGHHSERSARADQKRMHNAMSNSIKESKKAQHYDWKRAGVAANANRKSRPDVRQRRIKKLLADMRKWQRTLDGYETALKFWNICDSKRGEDNFSELVMKLASGRLGRNAPHGLWSDLDKGEITASDAVTDMISRYTKATEQNYERRWITHIIHRIGYEVSELGETPRFEGDLTKVMIQKFMREQGADKPKAVHLDGGFIVKAKSTLPMHIGDGKELTLVSDDWLDLMQQMGHVPDTTPKAKPLRQTCSLINLSMADAQKLQDLWNKRAMLRNITHKYMDIKAADVLAVPQAKYSANSKGSYSAYSVVKISSTGVELSGNVSGKLDPVARIRRGPSGHGQLYGPGSVIHIMDKTTHALPFDIDKLLEESDIKTAKAIAERDEKDAA